MIALVAQLCAAQPPGGVVVTDGRGGFNAAIAARAGAVVVGWQEARPSPAVFTRELAAATLAPRGPAAQVTVAPTPPEHLSGFALAPATDGIGVAFCTCYGGSGTIACASRAVTGTFAGFAPRAGTGGCSTGVGLATAGANALVAWTNAATLSFASSATRVAHTTEGDVTADALAITRADNDRAVLAWRTADSPFADGSPDARALVAVALGPDARPASRPVNLSGSGRRGAPALAWIDGAAQVVYARAASPRAPWQLARTAWTPGRRPVTIALATGRAPAMAPAIAPSRAAGCAVVSFTEGSGRATVVRAGRVCAGRFEAASLAQLSTPGVEAGDSELASDGEHVYVVWQEVPAERGVREVLRVARVGCD
jgi:hypothetical protein